MSPARASNRPSRPFAAFARRVYAIVHLIPRGRVMTYGAIASLIPVPAGMAAGPYHRVRARWVGYAMARCPEEVPWQRVVNAHGRVSRRSGHGPHIQQLLLTREGVRFTRDGRIALARFAWNPAPRDSRAPRRPRGTPGASAAISRRARADPG